MRYRPDKHRLEVFTGEGILLVDKPAGWTSFDVVNMVRSRFNVPKVGHCGTLDPAATGLLVLLLGRFTRLAEHFSGENKSYEAVIRLGAETPSMDSETEITAERDFSGVTREMLERVLEKFRGEIMQVPPMVSALKVGGRRLYELARQGVEIPREPRPVTIFRLELGRFEPPFAALSVDCSKGTYIRSLAGDIGRELGCGAMLAELRRTVSGRFDIASAVSVETVKGWEQADLALHLRQFIFDRAGELSEREEETGGR